MLDSNKGAASCELRVVAPAPCRQFRTRPALGREMTSLEDRVLMVAPLEVLAARQLSYCPARIGETTNCPAGRFSAVALIVLINERQRAIRRSRGTGQFCGQPLIRAAHIVIPHHGDGASLVNRGANQLEVIRDLPKYLAIGGLLDIFIGKARDLFIAVEHHAQTVASGAFLQETDARGPRSTVKPRRSGPPAKLHSRGH